MRIQLSLDGLEKQILSELLMSTFSRDSSCQMAMDYFPEVEAKDRLSVFRIAKEFDFQSRAPESSLVQIGDLVGLVRYSVWILKSSSRISSEPLGGKAQVIRKLIVAVLLQGQTQCSDFELILRTMGVDRLVEDLESPRIDSEQTDDIASTRDVTHSVLRFRLANTFNVGSELGKEKGFTSLTTDVSKEPISLVDLFHEEGD